MVLAPGAERDKTATSRSDYTEMLLHVIPLFQEDRVFSVTKLQEKVTIADYK